MARPSISELEALLQREDQVEIEILPNGEVRAKDQTSSSERGGRKPLTMREDLGGEYGHAGAAMNVARIQQEIRQAAEHFPNIETHATTDGGIYVKAALQTSVGQMYIIAITFVGYPSSMPKVTVLTPAVSYGAHKYIAGHLCLMHPSCWNPAKHDLKYVLAQTAVWLNKHEVYKVKGVWPGPSLSHTG